MKRLKLLESTRCDTRIRNGKRLTLFYFSQRKNKRRLTSNRNPPLIPNMDLVNFSQLLLFCHSETQSTEKNEMSAKTVSVQNGSARSQFWRPFALFSSVGFHPCCPCHRLPSLIEASRALTMYITWLATSIQCRHYRLRGRKTLSGLHCRRLYAMSVQIFQ